MYLYVELWNARPAWRALPLAEREAFFTTVGQRLEAELAAGSELVGVAVNDAATPRRADYQFLAVWKLAEARVPDFEATWERIGWHDYFEQANARGALLAPDTFIGQHIAL
jgi:hypothetical protein